MYDPSDFLADKRGAPAITDREIEIVADAIIQTMFAPHEIPLNSELYGKYCQTALAAIIAYRAIQNAIRKERDIWRF